LLWQIKNHRRYARSPTPEIVFYVQSYIILKASVTEYAQTAKPLRFGSGNNG